MISQKTEVANEQFLASGSKFNPFSRRSIAEQRRDNREQLRQRDSQHQHIRHDRPNEPQLALLIAST
jgi:hypothetical protein